MPGDVEADVAIVGAGYTGLWTAYYLRQAEPSTRQDVDGMQNAMAGTVDEVVVVAERENIDADILRVDNLTVATNPPQLERVKAMHEQARRWDTPAS